MKWFKKKAQGLNPGLVDEEEWPESGTRIWDWLAESKYEYQEHARRAPLSGHIQRGHAYSGLKPWAVLSDHFMVKSSHECRPTRTRRSQITPRGTITDY
jgi:hypothetical protein